MFKDWIKNHKQNSGLCERWPPKMAIWWVKVGPTKLQPGNQDYYKLPYYHRNVQIINPRNVEGWEGEV